MCNGFLINNEGLKEDLNLGFLKFYLSVLRIGLIVIFFFY